MSNTYATPLIPLCKLTGNREGFAKKLIDAGALEATTSNCALSVDEDETTNIE